MGEEKPKLTGPDLTKGVDLNTISDGTILLGHARGEPVLLVGRGNEVFAIGTICTHYGAPLEQGLLVGDTVRCPWHHACFSLRTGEAVRAPALDPVSHWKVEVVREFTPAKVSVGAVYVREKLERVTPRPQPASAGNLASVVIIGGGGAGNAAAEALRSEGYSGRITMLSADEALPCDRPKLSKGFLAGSASEEAMSLRSTAFYRDHDIDLKLGTPVASVDTVARHVQLADGRLLGYDALLLATGAEPVRLDVPGVDLPHVHTLRSLADSRAIVAAATRSKRAVVIGACQSASKKDPLSASNRDPPRSWLHLCCSLSRSRRRGGGEQHRIVARW